MAVLKYFFQPKLLIRKIRNFILIFSLGRIESYIKAIYNSLDKLPYLEGKRHNLDIKTSTEIILQLKASILKPSSVQFVAIDMKEWSRLNTSFNNLLPLLSSKSVINEEHEVLILIKKTNEYLTLSNPDITKIKKNIMLIKHKIPLLPASTYAKLYSQIKQIEQSYYSLDIRIREQDKMRVKTDILLIESEKKQREHEKQLKYIEQRILASEKEGEKDGMQNMTHYIKRLQNANPKNFEEIIGISESLNEYNTKEQVNDINLIPNLYTQLEEYIYQKGEQQQIQLECILSENLIRDTIKHNTNEYGIEIIDWGCGQAFATTCFMSFFEEQLKEFETSQYQIKQICLIDASSLAIKRGVFHLDYLISKKFELQQFPRITIVSKNFSDLSDKDFKCINTSLKIHFLSNILIDSLEIVDIYKLIYANCKGFNMFICSNGNISLYARKKVDKLIALLNERSRVTDILTKEDFCHKLNSKNEAVPIFGKAFNVYIS